MLAISPRLASELAEIVYRVIQPGSTGIYKLTQSPELNRHFSFDLSQGPINGSSGGLFGLYRKTSGFAMIGHGKGRFQNHHVFAMRGTKVPIPDTAILPKAMIGAICAEAQQNF